MLINSQSSSTCSSTSQALSVICRPQAVQISSSMINWVSWPNDIVDAYDSCWKCFLSSKACRYRIPHMRNSHYANVAHRWKRLRDHQLIMAHLCQGQFQWKIAIWIYCLWWMRCQLDFRSVRCRGLQMRLRIRSKSRDWWNQKSACALRVWCMDEQMNLWRRVAEKANNIMLQKSDSDVLSSLFDNRNTFGLDYPRCRYIVADG